ncbi:MAG: zinc ribbon domain-containing protein, partial [Acidimicrobiales bacterium]
MPTVAYPPDVFTWPADEPQLIAGRCADCQAIAFPVATSCPRCG